MLLQRAVDAYGSLLMFLCWIINLAFAASSFFSVKFCARVVEFAGYFVERKAEAEKCLKNW